MNIKNNMGLILKVSISLMFAAYVGFEVYKSMTEDLAKDSRTRFFVSLADDVTKIQLLAGTTQVHLKKDNSMWFIEKPIQEKANEELINEWLKTLKDSFTEAIPSDYDTEDVMKYGLHDPLATLKFSKSDGKSFEVSVSATKNFNGQNYLSYSDENVKDKVLTSNFAWFDFILKKPIDFINTHKVMAFDGGALQSVKFRNLNPQKETEKNPYHSLTQGEFTKDKDLWRFKGKAGVDGAKVLSLLSLLKSTIVYSFEPDPAAFKNNKNVKSIFDLEFNFKDRSKDKISVYNYFRPCVLADPKKNCQLVMMDSKAYPLWVESQDMTTILNLEFLKK